STSRRGARTAGGRPKRCGGATTSRSSSSSRSRRRTSSNGRCPSSSRDSPPASRGARRGVRRGCCRRTSSCSGTRSMRRFSEELRESAAELWEAQYRHPFVRGIGDGTLDPGRFRFYVRQDYLFLVEYGRLLALACARAPRLELMARFADLAQSTLRTEMELHRAYAAEWGIAGEELEAEPAAPATRAYADFL